MRYTIYKLSFPNGIHIGTGNLSSTEKVIHSDTLFSAMCIEALNMGGEEKLNLFVQMAKDNQLRISDAMPYIGDTMYLPKPMIRIEGTDKDSALKKEFKNIRHNNFGLSSGLSIGKNENEICHAHSTQNTEHNYQL